MSPESRLRSATRVCFLGQNHRNAESSVRDPRGPGLSLLPPPPPRTPHVRSVECAHPGTGRERQWDVRSGTGAGESGVTVSDGRTEPRRGCVPRPSAGGRSDPRVSPDAGGAFPLHPPPGGPSLKHQAQGPPEGRRQQTKRPLTRGYRHHGGTQPQTARSRWSMGSRAAETARPGFTLGTRPPAARGPTSSDSNGGSQDGARLTPEPPDAAHPSSSRPGSRARTSSGSTGGRPAEGLVVSLPRDAWGSRLSDELKSWFISRSFLRTLLVELRRRHLAAPLAHRVVRGAAGLREMALGWRGWKILERTQGCGCQPTVQHLDKC